MTECQHPAISMSPRTGLRTLSKSMGYMTECSCLSISLVSLHLLILYVCSRQCQQRRQRPCWPPVRSSVGGTHIYRARISSDCPSIAARRRVPRRTRILPARPAISFCRYAARPCPAWAEPESNRQVSTETCTRSDNAAARAQTIAASARKRPPQQNPKPNVPTAMASPKKT